MTIIDISNWLQSPTATAIFAALFMLSEALASIPAIRANSVFQIIAALLQKFQKPSEKAPL